MDTINISSIIKERVDAFELKRSFDTNSKVETMVSSCIDGGIHVTACFPKDEINLMEMEYARDYVEECRPEIVDLEEHKMSMKKISLVTAMAAAVSSVVTADTFLSPFGSRFMGKRNFLKDTRGSKEVQVEKQRLAQEKRDKKQKNRLRNIALAEQGKDYV